MLIEKQGCYWWLWLVKSSHHHWQCWCAYSWGMTNVGSIFHMWASYDGGKSQKVHFKWLLYLCYCWRFNACRMRVCKWFSDIFTNIGVSSICCESQGVLILLSTINLSNIGGSCTATCHICVKLLVQDFMCWVFPKTLIYTLLYWFELIWDSFFTGSTESTTNFDAIIKFF